MTNSLMGSENSADQAWDFVSSWFLDIGWDFIGARVLGHGVSAQGACYHLTSPSLCIRTHLSEFTALSSAHTSKTPLTIATRESRLAMWQAHHVKALLEQRGHPVSLLGMTTQGDQILDRSLSKVGGKGLFVKELEVALEEGRANLAVHSLKDVPMDLPAGFDLACVMVREDPRDARRRSRDILEGSKLACRLSS